MIPDVVIQPPGLLPIQYVEIHDSFCHVKRSGECTFEKNRVFDEHVETLGCSKADLTLTVVTMVYLHAGVSTPRL